MKGGGVLGLKYYYNLVAILNSVNNGLDASFINKVVGCVN